MLKELTEAFGPSGAEVEVQSLVKKAIAGHVDRTAEDDFGNLYAFKGKKGKKIMLVAHADEVGLMVSGIDRNGTLRFKPVGGIDPRVLPGKPVLITKDRIPGVIAHKPGPFSGPDELKKIVPADSMFIDIGAGSKEEAEKQVRLGDYVIFDTKFADDGDIFMGKAFDDRLGCYVLARLAKKEFDAQIVLVFSVQEEVGCRGAKIAGFKIKPDCALAVEVTSTNDLPPDPEKDTNRAPFLRKGPAVTVADQSVICDRDLVRAIIETAEKNRIPCQMKPPMVGGTDAGAVHLQQGGIKAAVLSCPVRYIHSPCSIASYGDLALLEKLLPLVVTKFIEEVKCN